jgi:DNA-binding FadR family transcriptional regulator
MAAVKPSASSVAATRPPAADGEEADLARDVVFAPIGGEGLVQQTVRRLGEAIGLGLLREGERLPSEAELAERFEIASMTLREALAILRQAGYIETRRGRGGGTIVKRATPFPPAREARRHMAKLTSENLRDLTDYRAATAGYAAMLAAERATPAQIDELRGLVDAMDGESSEAEYRRLDSRLHIGIASATGSRRLVASETTVQRELTPLLALFRGPGTPPASLASSNKQHRVIVDAIAAQDPQRARAEMESHVAGTAEMLIGLRLGMLR